MAACVSSSGQPVMMQIDCLQAAEGALDPGEALIGADHLPAARALFSTLGDSTSGAAGLSLDVISLDELWLRLAAETAYRLSGRSLGAYTHPPSVQGLRLVARSDASDLPQRYSV
jgi:hypothetical protein